MADHLDQQFIPLFNFLKPFFDNQEWIIAKCNAFIKNCICGTVKFKEDEILENLLIATRLTSSDLVTIEVTKPEGFDDSTVE